MVFNRHERILKAPAERVGHLIDQLASSNDAVWPHNRGWPPMKFDRPLQVGAVGGHGPIGYTIDQYTPSQKIAFRFTAPKGFIGTHGLYLESINANQTRLVHELEAKLEGNMKFSWIFLFRPMHDALVEDALDNAQLLFEPKIKRQSWSWYVKFLRLMMRFIRQAASKSSNKTTVKTER
jgi:hypothetical protein